jgi:hypothetical protein
MLHWTLGREYNHDLLKEATWDTKMKYSHDLLKNAAWDTKERKKYVYISDNGMSDKSATVAELEHYLYTLALRFTVEITVTLRYYKNK